MLSEPLPNKEPALGFNALLSALTSSPVSPRWVTPTTPALRWPCPPSFAISLLVPTDRFPQTWPSLGRVECQRAVTSGSAHAGRRSCPPWGRSRGFRRRRGRGPHPPDAGIFAWAGIGWGHIGEHHRDDLGWGDGSERKQGPSMSSMGPKATSYIYHARYS